jgi:DNA-binding PadR family transcriptional regulator
VGRGRGREIAAVVTRSCVPIWNDLKPGSLFPAPHHFEEQGWLQSSRGESENLRKAKFHKLTSKGSRQLRDETHSWGRLALAMRKALEAH